MILRVGDELERVQMTHKCQKSHCDAMIHTHVHGATDDWKTFIAVCSDGHESELHIDDVYAYEYSPEDDLHEVTDDE